MERVIIRLHGVNDPVLFFPDWPERIRGEIDAIMSWAEVGQHSPACREYYLSTKPCRDESLLDLYCRAYDLNRGAFRVVQKWVRKA
jgi:hypothetical protein